MIKSTASAGPVEVQGSPSAYYLWEFPEKPVSVRLSLDVVDRLERDVLESFRAITARGSEVGGLLLGRTETGTTANTIIENYELFHCDYTRGPLYLLSDEEKSRLEDVIRRKKSIPGQAGVVVGFFRSNTRKDLALDEEDLDIFREYFSRPEQAFLLVKPFAAKPSMAGIFIWEDSRVRAEGSYIEFPFRRSELGKGQFAKSIVIDAPKQKETPAETPAAPASADKRGSRAQVLPFSLRRDEEPPVPAPPLKKEERPAVISLAPKTEAPKMEEPAVAPKVEAPVKLAEAKLAEPPAARKQAEKPTPALTPLREEKQEAKREAKKADKQEEKKEAAKKEPAASAKSAVKEEAAPAAKETREAKTETAAPEPTLRFESLPERSPFGGKKLWALFGGLTMLALAGGTLYYLKTKDTAPTVAVRDGGFQLKAERSNGQLLVSWNRQSEIIQKAQSAVLSITDGAKTEDVPLDLAQLRAGSIMYSPLSGDVSFRLEVKDGGAGKSRSEFVRMPVEQTPDPGTSANPAGAKLAAQQAQLATPAQPTPQPAQAGQPKPAPAEASRIDNNPPAETTQPARSTTEPPKPFSLAARIHQPEPSDLPEAPSVGPSAAGVTIRPSTPGRLPAPPPPVAPPPQPPSQPQAQSSAPPVAPTQPPANVRVGGKVQEPKLLRRVDAAYPPMARQARVGGVVRIQATIGRDGKVKKIEVLSGPPLLRQAAIDAVQKWVYSPSLLNGSPVEATTDVDVSFNLSQR